MYMTREQIIKAILECYFGNYKEEIIESACERILEVNPDKVKVVIDIDKKFYNEIKSDIYNTYPAEWKEHGLEAIRNGTKL